MHARYKAMFLEARGCRRDLGQLVSETPAGPKPQQTIKSAAGRMGVWALIVHLWTIGGEGLAGN